MYQDLAGQSAEAVIDHLGLAELPGEGGFWKAGPRTAQMNSIFYLMTPSGFSAMHQLTVSEGWQWLAGASAQMLQLRPDGKAVDIELGPTWPQTVVEPGTWQGCSTNGEWTLVSCWCAPAFTDDCFTLGARAELAKEFAGSGLQIAKRIEELTR